MNDLVFRTEDLRSDEVLALFAEGPRDREIVDALKTRNPIVLVGSRGVGKSFLMRVAEAELHRDFSTDRVLPVYLSFTRSSLVQLGGAASFEPWMLAKLCSRLVKSLRAIGAFERSTAAAKLIAGEKGAADATVQTAVERLEIEFESSWQYGDRQIDSRALPTVDVLKDAIEEIAERTDIRRFVMLFDEAAHVFLPAQQREFFTLFRDLRSPFLSCDAAVYPGVTSFGDTFQPAHDASILTLDRDVLDRNYVAQMREIVSKQADSALQLDILKNPELFAVLAYAASGNPRLLLKTLARAERLTSDAVNSIFKGFYRTELWAEHTALGEKYRGHQPLIDWGRTFIEEEVLPALRGRSVGRLGHGGRSTAFFWIHKDAPQTVREALRLLAYTGMVIEHSTGIKASRSQIGTRYLVNLGVLFSGLEPSPASQGFELASALDPRLMTGFGSNHPSFERAQFDLQVIEGAGVKSALQDQLTKSLDVLDITAWQKSQLRSLQLSTVGDVLAATETELMKAYYVGEKRSRRIRNAAVAAVLEYLSG